MISTRWHLSQSKHSSKHFWKLGHDVSKYFSRNLSLFIRIFCLDYQVSSVLFGILYLTRVCVTPVPKVLFIDIWTIYYSFSLIKAKNCSQKMFSTNMIIIIKSLNHLKFVRMMIIIVLNSPDGSVWWNPSTALRRRVNQQGLLLIAFLKPLSCGLVYLASIDHVRILFGVQMFFSLLSPFLLDVCHSLQYCSPIILLYGLTTLNDYDWCRNEHGKHAVLAV